MRMKKFRLPVPECIETLVPYPPGKPIEELERELGVRNSIKLASNENPLGPSPLALSALEGALSSLHRYPDGSSFYLKRRMAELLNLSEEMIFLGNGSNEVIELLIRTFVSTGDEVVTGWPSFAVYPLVVTAAGANIVKVGLREDLTLDLDAMARAVGPKTRIVFIANPNNPTGRISKADELTRFLDSLPPDVIVCLDEAYFEYVRSEEYQDSLSYVKEGRPVVVLRTFSKIYGLAGLRIGYAVAPAEITDYMNRVRQPFNVNSLAQAAALAALADTGHIEKSRANNEAGIEYLFKEFAALGFDCVPTEANFFLVKVGRGKEIYDALLKRGVIVRPMGGYCMDEYIRVTVGTRDENARLIETMGSLFAGDEVSGRASI